MSEPVSSSEKHVRISSQQQVTNSPSGDPKLEALATKRPPQPTDQNPASFKNRDRRGAVSESDVSESSIKRFSERTFAIPFGKYQASGEAGGEDDEVMVGRSGQRAYFIDLLLRAGRRGAFLVTGNRGVGKSSFVRYCLEEYEDEVFDRFLRSNVGRALFWDRLLVLGLGLIFVLLALIASEVLELMVLSASQPSGANDPSVWASSTNVILWLLIAPLAVICAYPLLFAQDVLTEVFSALFCRDKGPLEERGGISALSAGLSLLLLAGFAWNLGPFGAPAIGMSRLLVGISAIYLWVQSTSFRRVPRKASERWQERLFSLWWWCSVGFVLLVGVYVFGSGLDLLAGKGFPLRKAIEAQLCLALVLFGWGATLQGVHRLIRNRAPEQKEREPAALWYVAGGGVFCLVIILFSLVRFPQAAAAALGAILVSLVLFVFCHRVGHKVPETVVRWLPRPLLGLSAKAFLSIVVALQLTHPILANWRHPLITDKPNSALLKTEGERERSNLRRAIPLRGIPGSDREGGESPNSPRDLFHGRDEELLWVLGLFLCLGVLYFMDYEWVLRPSFRARQDKALDPPQKQEDSKAYGPVGMETAEWPRRIYRRLSTVTLPRLVYATWLPTLMVSVNLGFEKLDHRRVVQAMLAGLRAQFHRTFLAWNSGIANIGRLLGGILLLMMVNLVGERWFSMPPLEAYEAYEFRRLAGSEYEQVCNYFDGRQKGTGAANVICKLKWRDSIFHSLYFDFLGSRSDGLFLPEEEHMFFYLFPYEAQDWPLFEPKLKPLAAQLAGPVQPEPLLKSGLHFRVYHLLLLIMFMLIGRWLFSKLPVFPYREVRKRIDEMLDSLTAVTSVSSKVGRFQPTQLLEGLFTDERMRQTQQDPLDPRTVEFQFLRILTEMQAMALRLPGARNQLVSLPLPEITFVFDELDKLGTRVEPLGEGESTGIAQQIEVLNAERRRSLELHRLLADMKNLLSSAPARFIFVGGRNLHDEWLADQTSRQPLLTNIFNAEVYLPSLLTDHPRLEQRKSDWLEQKVKVYLAQQIERSRRLYDRFLEKLALPSVALPPAGRARESYLDPDEERLKLDQWNPEKWTPIGWEKGEPLKVRDVEEGQVFPGPEIARDLVQFLAYRSTGNPKRLKELLVFMVRPVGRVVRARSVREEHFQCEHVLALEETDRFRIQLISSIFRQLAAVFEKGFARRDDKMVTSVLFLADFLFKFHRRAFSWSNLERVEDMVHIHRAPDVREVLESIVINWSEIFLHRIRNGMYDFRFRSELAREIEHISRQSPQEMAAFNFTLDESQALKAVYEANLRRLGDKDTKELKGMVAGLGELYEFDQEFETARFYYRKAISLLDKELEAVVGDSMLDDETPIIDILGGKLQGQKNARLYLTWGISRLRLMLQIGMTFELSRNLEYAQVEYQNARTLARALLLSMLDEEGRLQMNDPDFETGGLWERGGDRLHALKHLNILFQPTFAEAWVAEKLEGGVDTSIALAKKELWELRKLLPFVREPWVPQVRPVQHSSFALIFADLHGKLGDLYFFKGRQSVQKEEALDILREAEGRVTTGVEEPRKSFEGYLLRAHYHYAVSLHMLRRFTSYRITSSPEKLNIWGDKWETISSGGWPDFVYRAAGATFNDCAEVMLGRISLLGMFANLTVLNPSAEKKDAPGGGDVEKILQDLQEACTSWMEGAMHPEDRKGQPVPIHKIEIPLGRFQLSCDTLENWIGVWKGITPASPDELLIEYPETRGHGDLSRLAVALNLMLVGAHYLKKGGYVEEAAREFLKVCQAVNRYLWAAVTVEWLIDWSNRESLEHEILVEAAGPWKAAFSSEYWGYLLRIAGYALQKSGEFFLLSRRSSEKVYVVGDKIPLIVVVAACSLGLVAKHWAKGPDRVFQTAEEIRQTVDRLLQGWRFDPTGTNGNSAKTFQEILKESIVRHSYPMVHRLHGLRILIDEELLSGMDLQPQARERILSRTEELLDLVTSLDAPLHFTPLHLGMTCALVFLSHWGERQGKDAGRIERIHRAAQRNLLKSEEMSTMRWAHYESIANLYYLYDDYNDRQAHFNHAIQMAGLELVTILRGLIDPTDESRKASENANAEPQPVASSAVPSQGPGSGVQQEVVARPGAPGEPPGSDGDPGGVEAGSGPA